MSRTLATKSKQEIFYLTKSLIPPLLPSFYKGQQGKILVFGGEYNGAVFFSADSSAKTGADLVHVVCTKDVAQVIKCYSPDLMVHPYLIDGETADGHDEDELIAKYVMPKVSTLLDRIDVVAMGSGLGRSSMNLKTAAEVLKEIKRRNLPVVLDADSLFLLAQSPELIQGYQNAIVTPNLMEFKRLFDKLEPGTFEARKDPRDPSNAIRLSKLLGGVTVVQKGAMDIIAREDEYIVNDSIGSNRRCGGQGDTLSGSMATFLAWGQKYKAKLWPHDDEIDEKWVPLLAAYGASSVVRKASYLAFQNKKRSMQATDLHSELANAFEELFPTETHL
ncbi:NADHX dehydratase [Saccharomycopsis crataegensis]|uniref:ATP-dependent (S)-NAD(P)H-hydrate dehydratase n=1 Tax=Saccharomycopsis crataegensis TaxID=43959 RepID=A0AAV5QDU3_9ASCO|nr:NADHX dehydratase [Saccharomycopsis crataegensis]